MNRLRLRPSGNVIRAIAAMCLALALGACAGPDFGAMAGSVASVGGLLSRPEPGQAWPIQIFVAHALANESAGDGGVSHSLTTVSVPPGHKIGQIEGPGFGGRRPDHDFMIAGRRPLSEAEFMDGVATHLSGRVGVDRDVLVYVHGFNTGFDEARFRLAQVVADGRFGGVPVLFAWPSRASVFAYEADKESATAARDRLQTLLERLGKLSDVGRIHVLAHSMGAWLTMEALRQASIAGDRTLSGKLGDVMLAAPDIDLNVFLDQMHRVGPARVTVFAATNDKALSLSSLLAGSRRRLGAIDARDPATAASLRKAGVKVVDVTHESRGWIGHGTFADAPSVVAAIGAQLAASLGGPQDAQATIDAGVAPDAGAAPPVVVDAPAPVDPANAPVQIAPAN
ncbi:MAG: alpha/beta hydrolase [Hyphomicrobiales bacterium]|nr:alpha/beta hydrolase [Hyphomicrobiales bacterium]MDE2017881.1 alpha/beta hydrolase [Hyphomicrobiales bacterium]